MGDLHKQVVDGDGEQEHGEASERPARSLATAGREPHHALHDVVDHLSVGHAEPHDGLASLGLEGSDLPGTQVAAMTVVAGCLVAQRLCAASLELVGGAVAR